MLRGLLVTVLFGCGRIGFDALGDDTVAGGAPWQLIQTAAAEDDTRTSTVRVKPLGTGNLVVVGVELDRATGTVTTVVDSSGCNTYVSVGNAAASSNELDQALELFYATKSCPGATTVTITATAPVAGAAVWEVAGIRTTNPLDVAGALDDQPSSGRVLGPPLTTSAAGDFVVAVALAEFFITDIHAGDEFTNDRDADGNGWAHLVDAQAPAGTYQAEWDALPAGSSCASAAAFRAGP